ncbi:MAG: UvrB/UvrC motif-containing protein, partial [Acidobacteriaceae bacterium]|nr:UvrB/UvrC motif-containing protein [Acidobacteriaceae bacterium]
AYNEEHGITPQSIVKAIDAVIGSVYERDYMTPALAIREGSKVFRTQAELDEHIDTLQARMRAAATNLDFEKAATLRDDIKRLRSLDAGGAPWPARRN